MRRHIQHAITIPRTACKSCAWSWLSKPYVKFVHQLVIEVRAIDGWRSIHRGNCGWRLSVRGCTSGVAPPMRLVEDSTWDAIKSISSATSVRPCHATLPRICGGNGVYKLPLGSVLLIGARSPFCSGWHRWTGSSASPPTSTKVRWSFPPTSDAWQRGTRRTVRLLARSELRGARGSAGLCSRFDHLPHAAVRRAALWGHCLASDEDLTFSTLVLRVRHGSRLLRGQRLVLEFFSDLATLGVARLD